MPVTTRCQRCKGEIELPYHGVSFLCESCWADDQHAAGAIGVAALRALTTNYVVVLHHDDKQEDKDTNDAD